MKKTPILLILAILTAVTSQGQIRDGMIAQPTHIIGKRINTNGEVTMTLESDFTYYENGKPHTFVIPDYFLSTSYHYNDDYLHEECTWHNHDYSIIEESLVYTYEDGKIKTIEHNWSSVNPNELWVYTYDDEGRLSRKDYMDDLELESHRHYIYEYENDNKTKTQYYWTSWDLQGMLLRQKTVFQYDDENRLITRLIEDYSAGGELTNSTFDSYTYTNFGKLETQITQTLVDDNWINSHIMHYIYGSYEQVLEQQDGSWSAETNEWIVDHRVVFELSENGATYTVSFYKKSGEVWVWDVFNNQTILFGSALQNQQRTLRFYQDEVNNGMGGINQFEITLTYTPKPIYMDTEEKGSLACVLHPNPTTNLVTITGKDLKRAEVFNTLGQRVATAKGEGERMTVDIGNLPAGVYMVNVTDKDGRKCVRKVVKE